MTKSGPVLVPILGDQLSRDLASLNGVEPAHAVLLMMEVDEETTYVRHHKAKIAFILSAMRHHAEDMRDRGWTVDYVKLDDPDNSGRFSGEIARAIERHDPASVRVTEPGEWRVRAVMDEWEDKFGIPVEICPDTRFLCDHAEFENWAEGRKQLRMEYFYREMRRKTGLLMDGDAPEGGKWNYDQDNRKPADPDLFMPKPIAFRPDETTKEVLDMVAERFADHPGSLDNFRFAVTHEEALRARRYFLDACLARFGDYQDAMLTGEPFLYHSLLSPYLNIGLLDPLDLCREAAKKYEEGEAPLNAVEGFIRQIIGWREYVRGVYWRGDDNYVRQNFFGNDRALPEFYWTGETDMNCVRQSVLQTKEDAYAHHIQRLMVTGLFALLAGVDPFEVHEWYLIVYADAFEWVEAPNVIGMSQYADGGELGSKPYAASGAYINRMSDYCKNCAYAVSKKTEENACPFNALYWDFLARNEDKLKGNPRLGQMYRTWGKMDKSTKLSYRARARAILSGLDKGSA